MADTLTITDLELWTRIGVPEAERRTEQRILVTIVLEPAEQRAGETDDVKDTVDYEELITGVRSLVKDPRRTLERLAEEITSTILKDKRIGRVSVTLRKFILPGTKEILLTIVRPL